MKFSLAWLFWGLLLSAFAQHESEVEENVDDNEMTDEEMDIEAELFRQRMEIKQKIQSFKAKQQQISNFPQSSPQVATAAYVIDYPDLKLPLGKSMTMLCHFYNLGNVLRDEYDENPVDDVPRSFNVTAIAGTLNVITDYAMPIQNLTFKFIPTSILALYDHTNPAPMMGLVIHPHEEATLDFQFTFSPFFDPDAGHQFSMTHTIFYTDQATLEQFATTFFNDTIDIYVDDEDEEFHRTMRFAEKLNQRGLPFSRPTAADEMIMKNEEVESEFWDIFRRSRLGRRKILNTRISVADVIQTIVGSLMTIGVVVGLKKILMPDSSSSSSSSGKKNKAKSSDSSSFSSRLSAFKDTMLDWIHEARNYIFDIKRMIVTGSISGGGKRKKKDKRDKKAGDDAVDVK